MKDELPALKKQKVSADNKSLISKHLRSATRAPIKDNQNKTKTEWPEVYKAQVCTDPEIIFDPSEIFLGIQILESAHTEEGDTDRGNF